MANTLLAQAASKCAANYKDIGGICFPGNTGLADPQNGIVQILGNLFTWLMVIFTILSVTVFVFSGIQYLASAANEELAKKAKSNANNAVIGIVVGLSGYIIVQAIMKALTGAGLF